ncbi:hypothetical protein RUM43_011905 [Polyplax serrata]|uniref:Uncharacterized protein n=1 Tax=Polyplax serrata TaxID=468196 RepID=A0AAN8PU23_POLSC
MISDLMTTAVISNSKPRQNDISKSGSGRESPGSRSPREPPDVEMTEKKSPVTKSKKSFCIDALLAKNESKTVLVPEEDSEEGRECENQVPRCFHKVPDELGKRPEGNDEENRKKFLEAFEKRTQKTRLLEHFGSGGKVSSPQVAQVQEGDGLYSAMITGRIREMDRLTGTSPECEIRRDYEQTSRSDSPFSGKSNETRSNSPGHSEMSSPPISPGNENDFRGNLNGNDDDFRNSQIFPRPGLLVNGGHQNFINQNPNLMLAGSRPNLPQLGPHSAFLSYSTPHSFTSAFHPAGNGNSKVTGANGSAMKTGVSSNSGNGILGLNAGGSQHLHHMQLEWLARTGMFYPRLPDLAGALLTPDRSTSKLLTIYWNCHPSGQ